MDAVPPTKPQAQKPQATHDPKHPLHSILKKSTAHLDSQKAADQQVAKPVASDDTGNPSTPTKAPAAKESTTVRRITPPPKKAHFTTPATKAARGTRRRLVFNRRKSSPNTVPKISPPRPRLTSSDPDKIDDSFFDDSLMQMDQNLDSNDSTDEDVESDWKDYDPFDAPSQLFHSPPSESLTPPEPDTVTAKLNALKITTHPPTPEITPLPDHPDPILPLGIETISYIPAQHKKGKNSNPTEFQSDSFSSESKKYNTTPVSAIDVPGFTNAQRIPMPAGMVDHLMAIITNTQPVQGEITTPAQPWVWCEGFWRTPTSRHLLLDWMIRHDESELHPQPSKKPLVRKDFRKSFVNRVNRRRSVKVNGK